MGWSGLSKNIKIYSCVSWRALAEMGTRLSQKNISFHQTFVVNFSYVIMVMALGRHPSQKRRRSIGQAPMTKNGSIVITRLTEGVVILLEK